MSVAEHVAMTCAGPIARITIDRPGTRNAIALQTAAELIEALASAERNSAVRVVVLSGAGDRAFASGADLDELAAATATPAGAIAYDAKITALYDAIQASRLPVIARIQASAIGGGCLLALACDLRVAVDTAKFGVPAGRIGLMLSVREHRLLVDAIGVSRAKLLLFSGRRIDASEALAWGLIDRVVPAAALDAEIDALASEIAASAPIAVQVAKRMVGGAMLPEEINACYDAIYTSVDLREGLASIKAKRAPAFRGC